MSSEPADKIQDVFIDQLGATYPYVTVDKDVVGAYGIRFYPSIYCIDPDGRVFSVPDDRMPSEAAIEKLLEGASVGPPLPDGAEYGPLRSMWKKKDYKKIHDYLEKMLAQSNLDAEMREVFSEQQQVLVKKVAAQASKVEKLAQGPDYYDAYERLRSIRKDWKGFPVAERAEAELERFKDDAEIKKEIASGKALARLLNKYDRSSISQNKKLMAGLRKFAESKRHRDSWAAEKARKLLSR